jgi:hypothetical protein
MAEPAIGASERVSGEMVFVIEYPISKTVPVDGEENPAAEVGEKARPKPRQEQMPPKGMRAPKPVVSTAKCADEDLRTQTDTPAAS